MSEPVRQLARFPQPFELNVALQSRFAPQLQRCSQCSLNLSRGDHYSSNRCQSPFLECWRLVAWCLTSWIFSLKIGHFQAPYAEVTIDCDLTLPGWLRSHSWQETAPPSYSAASWDHLFDLQGWSFYCVLLKDRLHLSQAWLKEELAMSFLAHMPPRGKSWPGCFVQLEPASGWAAIQGH